MPHRLVSLLILLFWTIAAGALFIRDILPTVWLGPPPDLRTIAQSDAPEGPVRWSILAADDDKRVNMRAVGQIVTETSRNRDNWVRMTSTAWLDSGELFRGTPFETAQSERVGVIGSAEIDSTGNLQHFRVSVRFNERGAEEILSLEGRLHKDMLEIVTRSPIKFLNKTQTFPYRPREIVQNSLGPLDRMPGLQVGQTWANQVISPLTGSIEACRVEVVGTEHIIWGSSPVMTLKVVTRMNTLSATTWVRPDGLVLRQEVPFIPQRIKLILERLPDDPEVKIPAAERNRR